MVRIGTGKNNLCVSVFGCKKHGCLNQKPSKITHNESIKASQLRGLFLQQEFGFFSFRIDYASGKSSTVANLIFECRVE